MIPAVGADQSGAGLQNLSDMRLKRVCSEFESLFIEQMLKTMRRTVHHGGLIGESNEGKILTSMYDEKLAICIAQSGGIGLGQMLFESIKAKE